MKIKMVRAHLNRASEHLSVYRGAFIGSHESANAIDDAISQLITAIHQLTEVVEQVEEVK